VTTPTRARRLFGAVAIVGASVATVSAQERQPRELGVHVAALHLQDGIGTDLGVGARARWPLAGVVALEATADFLLSGRGDVERGGRKMYLLAGPSASWRSDRGAIFGFGRAGLARIGEGRQEGVCIAVFPAPERCFTAENRPAVSFGAGVAIATTPTTALRAELASVWTRLKAGSASRPREGGSFARHTQVSAGFAVRF
jgi:hypothetical protein